MTSDYSGEFQEHNPYKAIHTKPHNEDSSDRGWFWGLASAALLAQQGHEVTVVEKNSLPGGRANKFTAKGFSYDMGPSWYLMPDIFENILCRV